MYSLELYSHVCYQNKSAINISCVFSEDTIFLSPISQSTSALCVLLHYNIWLHAVQNSGLPLEKYTYNSMTRVNTLICMDSHIILLNTAVMQPLLYQFSNTQTNSFSILFIWTLLCVCVRACVGWSKKVL